MRKSIIALSLLGAVLGIASVPADAAQRGPVRFVDHNGNDRGYLFCKKAGIDIFDCNYFSRAQCNASLLPGRHSCVVSPWAIEQGFDPFYGTAPQAPIKRKQAQRQAY